MAKLCQIPEKPASLVSSPEIWEKCFQSLLRNPGLLLSMHTLFTEGTKQRKSLEFGSLVPVLTKRLLAKLMQLSSPYVAE